MTEERPAMGPEQSRHNREVIDRSGNNPTAADGAPQTPIAARQALTPGLVHPPDSNGERILQVHRRERRPTVSLPAEHVYDHLLFCGS